MKTKTPLTGEKCNCKRGQIRDNCPRCEGTGEVIDFRAIRAQKVENHAKDQAAAQLESIVEMVKALEVESASDGENARQAIEESPLSVQVRSEWYTPRGDAGQRIEAAEFEILLCTGGPAVRIIGALGKYTEPESAELQYQDWGTPWTEYFIEDDKARHALLDYCRVFYFGE